MDSVIDVLQQKVVAARKNPKKNDREVIIITKETLKNRDSHFLTLYLTSVIALDELGIAYEQVGGSASILPWSSILRVHVRSKDLD